MDKLRLPRVALPKIALPTAQLTRHKAAQGDDGYVKDGLVFWFDGIDKGGVDGKWVDLVGGVEFVVNAEAIYPDGVSIKQNIPCATNTILNYTYQTSTIESCFTSTDGMPGYPIFDSGNPLDGLCVYPSYSGYVVGRLSYSALRFISPVLRKYGKQSHAMSIANDFALLDETVLRSTYSICGGMLRFISHPQIFFHSVRIYNRLLTEAEMRHNQEVDKKRFNLTFPEPVMTLEFEEGYTELDGNGQ